LSVLYPGKKVRRAGEQVLVVSRFVPVERHFIFCHFDAVLTQQYHPTRFSFTFFIIYYYFLSF
jgi:hypothetical protein